MTFDEQLLLMLLYLLINVALKPAALLRAFVQWLGLLLLSSSSGGIFSQGMLSYSGVGGDPAVCVDLLEDVVSMVPTWLCILFITTFFVLFLMTRSIILPLKAVILAFVTPTASLGILIRLFPNQTNSTVMHTLSFIPDGTIDINSVIFIVSVSFGLGVDYEVFVLAKVLEEYKTIKNNRISIIRAISSTGRIITSCAVMLSIVVFAFIGAKVLLLQEIGVGIAIGVMIDSFIVRMFLVPSFMMVMGEKYTWYCPQILLKFLDLIGFGENSNSSNAIDLEDDLDRENNAATAAALLTLLDVPCASEIVATEEQVLIAATTA